MEERSESPKIEGGGPESDPFQSRMVRDRPSPNDELGFKDYVDTLVAFITDAGTRPPLTVSIEGPWGSGKTSFMRQTHKRLQANGYETIWFNPWRHEQAREMWGTFMLSFIDSIRPAVRTRRRLLGDLSLLRSRLDESKVKRNLAWKGLLGVGALLLAAVTATAFGLFDQLTPAQLQTAGVVGAGGGLLAILVWSHRTVGRTEAHLRSYIDEPGYAERVPFIETLHQDITAILDAYIGDERVFVFIDDLDRCSTPRAAELMEAINLMLAKDHRLVFIVGMDRQKVAASIAVKHEKVLEFLGEDEPNDGHSFGSAYLEKFVQVPFTLPRPDDEEVRRFISDLVESTLPDDPETESGLTRDVPGWDRDRLEEVTVLVAPHLEYNPRKLKKFLNLYRLRVHLADSADLFDWQRTGTRSPEDLTLQQLGKFVAATVQWPTLTDALAADNELLNLLVKVDDDPDAIPEDPSQQFERWRDEQQLIDLLRAVPVDADPETMAAYDLSTVDVSELLQISPQLGTEMGVESSVLGEKPA